MAAQVTQAFVEVLRLAAPPPVRATQGFAEVLRTTTYPGQRVSQAFAEVLLGTQATVAVTQAFVEVLKVQGLPSGALVTQAFSEVLLRRPYPALVTQAVAEVLRLAAYPPVQITQAFAEVLVSRPRPALVTQAFAEVLVLRPASPPPPPPFVPPPPPAGAIDLPPLVNVDPTWDPRLRRFLSLVSEAFNSLVRQGYLTRSGVGKWAIGQPAGMTGVFSAGSFGAGAATAGEFLASLSVVNGLVAGGTFEPLSAADIPDLSATYQPLDADLTALAALSGTDTIYYRSGANTWSAVTIGSNLTFSGGTLSASGGGTDPKTSVYPSFTPAGVDDEFDGASFTGWTLVDDGTHTPTVTQANNVCSVSHPGSDTAGHLHAWLKTTTISVGDIIETVFKVNGRPQNFNVGGLMFADGTTYGSGKQVNWYFSPAENGWRWNNTTGFNTQVTGATFTSISNAACSDVYLRLQYTAANTFVGYASIDGVSWANLTGNISVTMTPAACGFFVSTWGGTLPCLWSFRYFRKHT